MKEKIINFICTVLVVLFFAGLALGLYAIGKLMVVGE